MAERWKMMRSYKYLDDLGVPIGDQYQNWFEDLKDDDRSPQWEEQRKLYGIDERATWNWNQEYMDYCYIHLKLYDQVNRVDLDAHQIVFDGEELTVQEAMDAILEWFEKVYYPNRGEDIFKPNLSSEENSANLREFGEGYSRVLTLLAKIMPYMWW